MFFFSSRFPFWLNYRIQGHSVLTIHQTSRLVCSLIINNHRLIRSLCQCDGSFGSVVDERKANNLYDVKSRVNIGRVFKTAVVSLNITENCLLADLVQQLKNDACFHAV